MPGAVLVCAWLVIASAHAADAKSAAASVSAGQTLYREGILGTGGALRAQRDNGTRVEGAAAACINCHRRSGLGNVEGNITVPPITAKYLFRSADANSGDLKMAHVEGYHQDHPAFDEASLAQFARALRPAAANSARSCLATSSTTYRWRS